jgi:hypothetical protein
MKATGKNTDFAVEGPVFFEVQKSYEKIFTQEMASFT